MLKRLLFFAVYLFVAIISNAQFIKIGEGNQLGTAGGPFYSDTSSSWISRYALIYPASVLGNMQHGDSLQSIEIIRSAGFAIQNNANLQIYVNNTSKTDWGTGKLAWNDAISGAMSVYNQNPQTDISTSEKYYRINFNNGKYFFDTTKGNNLIICFEWKQTASQLGRLLWYYDTKFFISDYDNNQCKWFAGRLAQDSLPNSTDAHVHMHINFPRFDQDVQVMQIYTMGKLPVPLGNPDSVMILVRNVGKKKLVSQQFALKLFGTNKLIDTIAYDINKFEEKFIMAPSLFPNKMGMDTVQVIGLGDQNAVNDSIYTVRLENENVYSYRDLRTGPSPGGIGFNGTTGNFVARFLSNKPKYINQVTVNFGLGGSPFRIAIWAQKTNIPRPGKMLWQSDSLISVAGNYILNIPKPVYVSGNFFVGVRQLSSNNVAFGYQDEYPVRPNTFFYSAPLADTNWTDFAPDAPFRFLIEPRLQADTDLAVISCDFPKDSIDAYTTDTLAPKATIQNIGVSDMKTKFDVHCEIWFNSKRVYQDVIQDTLSSGIKRQYTFAKKYFPKDYGEMKMLVFVKVKNDRVLDNDTGSRKFYVGVKKDVMIQSVYEPYNFQNYTYFTDSIVPLILVKNVGYDATGNFLVRCKITRRNSVLYNQTATLSFVKFESKIVNFPTYKCQDTGRLIVQYTTELLNDKFKGNDTQRFTVFVNKIYDLYADSVIAPGIKQFNLPNKPVTLTFRGGNDGLLEVIDAKYFVQIKGNYPGATTYVDSMKFTAYGLTKFTQSFAKKFTPTRKGIYSMKIFCNKISGDEVRANDTLKYTLYCGAPYDYRTISIDYPKSTDTLKVGDGPFQPWVKIQNNGFVKNTDNVPVICKIWYNTILVYNNISTLSLDTGQVFSVPFSKTLNPMNFGEYKVLFYTNYSADEQRNNDSIWGKFFVKIGKDPSVLQIDTPQVSTVFEAKTTKLNVAGKLYNYGELKVRQVKTYLDVFKGNKLVYSTNLPLDSLNGKQTKKVSIPTTYTFADSGKYKILLYCFSPEDQNPGNDSVWLTINVIKGLDVEANSWINPLDGQTILHTSGAAPLGILVRSIGTDTLQKPTGKVKFKIFAKPSGQMVYNDSANYSNLVSGNYQQVLTSSVYDFSTPGLYTAQAIQQCTLDKYTLNDTLLANFEVKYNAVKNLHGITMKIYPNPADKFIQIASNESIVSYEIYSLSGKLMAKQTHLNKSQFQIQLYQATPGNYLIHIVHSSGTSQSGYFMVR